MDILLTDNEVRLLGCLMEKEMATPDYYPLSLNALTNACNQKSNRNPVVSFDEETVIYALNGLQERKDEEEMRRDECEMIVKPNSQTGFTKQRGLIHVKNARE